MFALNKAGDYKSRDFTKDVEHFISGHGLPYYETDDAKREVVGIYLIADIVASEI